MRRYDAFTGLHIQDKKAHSKGKHGGQHATDKKNQIPDGGQQPVGFEQHRKELPLFSFEQSLQESFLSLTYPYHDRSTTLSI